MRLINISNLGGGWDNYNPTKPVQEAGEEVTFITNINKKLVIRI